MAHEVPSLVGRRRDDGAPTAAPTAAGDALAAPNEDPRSSTGDGDGDGDGEGNATKEARLLSQLLLLLSAKRREATAVGDDTVGGADGAAGASGNPIDPRRRLRRAATVSTAAGTTDTAHGIPVQFVTRASLEDEQLDRGQHRNLPAARATTFQEPVAVSGLAGGPQRPPAAGANAPHVHAPATAAARTTRLLRSRPSERELIQQFLLLPPSSQKKVAQSLFVIPPSLLEDFASVLQFFTRVLLEAHSNSTEHHTDGDPGAMNGGSSRKTCSWGDNGETPCIVRAVTPSSEPSTDDMMAPAPAAAARATTTNFELPSGFRACLVATYGSVERSKCEEVWHGDHMAYRCRTCGLSDSSCMCLTCFDPSDHEGHDYRVYRCASGGCCDCGDPLAWKPEGFCKRHRDGSEDAGSILTMGELERDAVHTIVRRVVAFSVNVLREVYRFCLRPPHQSDHVDATSQRPMRLLPKTGRRRSSFPAILQVHLDRLHQCLAWLQMLTMSCLEYRAVVSTMLFDELPSEFKLHHENTASTDEVPSDSRHTEHRAHTSIDEDRPPTASKVLVLDVFLQAGVLLPVDVCDTLGVMYLKLLFDHQFKQKYTCHFVAWYPYFIELFLQASEENNEDGMRNLSRFIDRLFCQLFHSTAQLQKLETSFADTLSAPPIPRSRGEHESVQNGIFGGSGPLLKYIATTNIPPQSCVDLLMTILLEKLVGLFKNALRVESISVRETPTPCPQSSCSPQDGLLSSQAMYVVDCSRNVFKKRIYARLCSDVRTLLVHPRIAGEVLVGSFDFSDGNLILRDGSVYALLVQAFALLQQMDLQQRQTGSHIEYESQNWTFAFVVDYEMNLLLSSFAAGLPYCFQSDTLMKMLKTDSFSFQNVELGRILLEPIRSALSMWASKNQSVIDGARLRCGANATETIGMQGPTKRSFHLPLHHLYAAFIQGISEVVTPHTRDDWCELLINRRDGRTVDDHVEMDFLFLLALPPIQVSMFAREIKAGLWVRNGNVMWQQLIHYYARHWRYYGLHSDLFMCQLATLLLPSGAISNLVLKQIQAPFTQPAPFSNGLDDVGFDRQNLDLLEDVLRFFIQLVIAPVRLDMCRDSKDAPTRLLEREIIHWLSLGPCTRSELLQHLDMRLVEQIRQSSGHKWYLWEEEEIVTQALHSVGEQNDNAKISTARASTPAALGCGMKMSTTWQLREDRWPEVSQYFECFSPTEAQLCEQNMRKFAASKKNARLPGILNIPTFAVSASLAKQLLGADSSGFHLFALNVLWKWRSEQHTRPVDREQGVDKISESLLSVVLSSLYLLVSLPNPATTSEWQGSTPNMESDLLQGIANSTFDSQIWQDREGYHSDCLRAMCTERRVYSGDTVSIMASLVDLGSITPPDLRNVAEEIVRLAERKCEAVRIYTTKYHQQSAKLKSSCSTAESHRYSSTQTKEQIRQRQQAVLARMRAQQMKFLSSHTLDEPPPHRTPGSACLNVNRSRENFFDQEDDDTEDDEWGFPTGHVDSTLYLNHLSSAIFQHLDADGRGHSQLRRVRQLQAHDSDTGNLSQRDAEQLEVGEDRSDDFPECALCKLTCGTESLFGYVAMILPTSLPTKIGISLPSPLESVSRNTNSPTLGDTCDIDAVVWTCGHTVHDSCIESYLLSLWKQRSDRNAVDVLQQADDRLLSERETEFLCPICRRLSNCLIPNVNSAVTATDRFRMNLPETGAMDTPVSFLEWLKSQMQADDFKCAPTTTGFNGLGSVNDSAVVTACETVRNFYKQVKIRALRAQLLLPLIVTGAIGDEASIEAELHHLAEIRRQNTSAWQLLSRVAEVELDVALREAAITGRDVDRQRRLSIELLVDNIVASVVGTTSEESRECSIYIDTINRVSDILFGRQVLLSDVDDDHTASYLFNLPLLSHPRLGDIFSTRLWWIVSKATVVCGLNARLNSGALSRALFTCRVVVTARILQAMATFVKTARIKCVNSPRSQRVRIITDFHDVESLSDAMDWMWHLLIRAKLIPSSSIFGDDNCSLAQMEEFVSTQCLPLVRQIVLLLEVCFPETFGKHADGTSCQSEQCAVCDELHSTRPVAGAASVGDNHNSTEDLRVLFRRLHLPPLRMFFRSHVFSPPQRTLCQRWSAQLESFAAVSRSMQGPLAFEHDQFKVLIPLELPEPRRLLMKLPNTYMDLFVKYSSQPDGMCKTCNQVPQHPAICLFCGTVLCCFSSCCESPRGRVGECTLHAQSCGIGIGAFLLLRACTVILFLGNERRCVWGSLYVDKNGEEDPYLRRGKTLYLASTRVGALEALLVSHTFSQNTAILANTSRRDGRRY